MVQPECHGVAVGRRGLPSPFASRARWLLAAHECGMCQTSAPQGTGCRPAPASLASSAQAPWSALSGDRERVCGTVCQHKRGERARRRCAQLSDQPTSRAHVDALRHHEDILQPRHRRLLRQAPNGAAMQRPEARDHRTCRSKCFSNCQKQAKVPSCLPGSSACRVPACNHQAPCLS